MQDKAEIRRLMRERAAGFSRREELAASLTVCEKLSRLPEFQSARRPLLYMSLPGEVQLQSLLDRFSATKTIVLPRVVGDSLELRAYSPSALVSGYKGILEPSDEAPVVSPSSIDFAVVPGVAFDHSGARLGHGRGFYDRLLPDLSCPVVGVCFDYRLIDALPTSPWDHPVDLLLTEKR